ncbi:hypothetical protein JCM8202v2_002189 [Rhodotorula sphaerocarpa]
MTAEPTAPIHWLPDELLGAILQFHSLAAGSRDLDLDTLKSASLVHSSWRDTAQRLIWEAGAELRTLDEVDQYIHTSSRRRGGPKEIAVYAARSTDQLARLFDVCTGVRVLMIATPTRDFDPAVLPPLAFPFRHLDSLVAVDLSPGRRSPLDSLLTQLARSCAGSLTSISLPSVPSHANESVAAALVPLAPHLKHLGLSLKGSPESEASFIPVFTSATKLRSFECTTLPYGLLPHLSPSLKVLATMEDADRIDPLQLRDGLLARCPKLRKLYFACTRSEFGARRGGEEVVQAAQARGIEWLFGDDLQNGDDE